MAGKIVVAEIKKFPIDTLKRMRDSVPTILHYAKAELLPPKPTELKEVFTGFRNVISSYRTKSYKDLTVKDAWLNTIVGLEILGWFWVGEVIGKKQLVGYPLRL